SISLVITVSTTPGSGFMPNDLSAITCEWPPPTRTIWVEAAVVCITRSPGSSRRNHSRRASAYRPRPWRRQRRAERAHQNAPASQDRLQQPASVQLDRIDTNVPAARVEEAGIVEDHAIGRHLVDT